MSFIPKQYKKATITIRIEEELLQNVDKLATRLDITRSELINQCVAYALEHMDTLPPETGDGDA